MAETRTVEIFSAGCFVCADAVARIRAQACPSCDVVVLDMQDAAVAARANTLGIGSLPAVVIDGTVADCCAGRRPDMTTLAAAGLGRPLS